VGYTNDTTATVRWASSTAVSYSISISGGGVTMTFTTSDTEYSIHGVVENTPYSISVVPMNQLCQGDESHVTVSKGTGNDTI